MATYPISEEGKSVESGLLPRESADRVGPSAGKSARSQLHVLLIIGGVVFVLLTTFMMCVLVYISCSHASQIRDLSEKLAQMEQKYTAAKNFEFDDDDYDFDDSIKPQAHNGGNETETVKEEELLRDRRRSNNNKGKIFCQKAGRCLSRRFRKLKEAVKNCGCTANTPAPKGTQSPPVGTHPKQPSQTAERAPVGPRQAFRDVVPQHEPQGLLGGVPQNQKTPSGPKLPDGVDTSARKMYGILAAHFHADLPPYDRRRFATEKEIPLDYGQVSRQGFRASGDENWGYYRYWKPTTWTEKLLNKESFCRLNDGNITIQQSGLYLVYSQITFHSSSNQESYVITINSSPLTRCIHSVDFRNMSLDSHQNAKYKTCYMAVPTALKKGDKVAIRHGYANRVVDFRRELSYFGLIKLLHLEDNSDIIPHTRPYGSTAHG